MCFLSCAAVPNAFFGKYGRWPTLEEAIEFDCGRLALQRELRSGIGPLNQLHGGGSMAQPSSPAGKRRSRRFPFISPVEATWQEANGKIFREAGQATEVNAQGGLLEMKTYPAGCRRTSRPQ